MQRSTSIAGLEEADKQSDEHKAKHAATTIQAADVKIEAQLKKERLVTYDALLSSVKFKDDTSSQPKKCRPTVYSEVDTSTMSSDLKIWDERFHAYLGKAVKEKKVDKFKFFLGPSFVSIRNRDWNEEYPKSEWDFFNEVLQFKFYSKLFEIISTWTPLLQNEMAISHCQDVEKMKLEQKVPDEDLENAKKRFSSFVASHERTKKNIEFDGIREYLSWTQKNASTIQTCRRGLFLGSEQKELSVEDQNIELNKVQAEIENLSNLFVLPYLEEQIKESFSVDGFNLTSHLQASSKKFLEHLMAKSPNLQALKANIKLKQSEFNVEAKYDELSKNVATKVTTYESEKLKIEEAYRSFATDWLKKNEKEVSELFMADVNGWKGATSHEMLINWFIEYKSFANTSRFPGQRANNVFSVIEQIDDDNLRSQFMSLMEEHWNSPRLKEITTGDAVKKISERRLALKKLLSSEEFPQDIVLKALQSDDSQFWLKMAIANPLDWPELTLLLEAAPCNSEAQSMLKNALLAYLQSRAATYNPITYVRSYISSFPRFDMSLNRKREIQYLIGCLYLASSEMQDEGILYKTSAEDLSIGVTYILELMPSETISQQPRLEWKLIEFIEKIKNRVPMLGNIQLKALTQSSSDESSRETKRQQASPLYGKKIIGESHVVTFGMFYPKTPNPNMVKKFHQVVLAVEPAENADEKAAKNHRTHSVYFRPAFSDANSQSKDHNVHSIHC